MSKWRVVRAIWPLLLGIFAFIGFDAPTWRSAMDWLTSVDLWIINNAAYPSLFALSVGVLLGTVVVPEAWGLFRKQFERDPKLRIVFDKTQSGFFHETGFSGTQSRGTYVRVLPICEARVNNCFGYLTGVFQWVAGAWQPTQYDERQPLKWGNVDSPQVSLHPASKQYLDIFFIVDAQNKINPAVLGGKIPKRAFNTFDDAKAVFRMDVAVMGDKDAYAMISLKVQTTDDWRNPLIEVLPEEPRRRWWQLRKA